MAADIIGVLDETTIIATVSELPPAGGVTTAMLADGAVTTEKLADGAVTAGKLDGSVAAYLLNPVTSGTADSGTYLSRVTAGGFPCGERATIGSIRGNTVVESGELVSVQMEGFESEDAGGNTLAQLPIPASTYFPQGMRSARNAADELTGRTAVTRIGAVTFDGSEDEDWSLRPNGLAVMLALADAAKPGNNNTKANAICAQYELQTANVAVSGTAGFGISMSANIAFATGSSMTVEGWRTQLASSPVTVYYALATPTAVTIDPPLDLTYRCAAGGTESVIVPTGHTSAPPTIDVTYEIDTDAMSASIAPQEGRIASANHTVGALLMLGGTLVKVTTAIASGEEIAIGTNVTATTVAAELAALS